MNRDCNVARTGVGNDTQPTPKTPRNADCASLPRKGPTTLPAIR
jgi:hypothetical protein